MTDLRMLFQPQINGTTVTRIGAPFTLRFVARCPCGTRTRPAAMLSLALDFASEHAAVHIADGIPRKRAA